MDDVKEKLNKDSPYYIDEVLQYYKANCSPLVAEVRLADGRCVAVQHLKNKVVIFGDRDDFVSYVYRCNH